MDLDKREFVNFSNIKSFPGFIDETTKEYHFCSLFNKDARDNIKKWEIKIRLIKGVTPPKHGIDWDLLLDNTIPIKNEYLSGSEIPNGSIAQMWSENGIIGGKQTRYAPSYPCIKNKGKSNERNVLEQALVKARSLYMKKLENGFSINKNFNKTTKQINTKYFPMLVRKYQDEKKNLTYPLYIQPKLDGARCIAFLDISPKKNPSIDNVIMYSRQKKNFTGFDDIKRELLPVLISLYNFDKNESIYIDGELYKHGMNLQSISGAVRNPDRDNISKYSGIQYWIFDIFYPHLDKLKFQERLGYLNKIFNKNNFKHLIQVHTEEVKCDNDQEKIYKNYINKKYEGIILRNMDSTYLTNQSKNNMSIRSKFVLKRKMNYDDEFELVDFTQGSSGKDIGAIIWILKTHDTNKLFNAVPKNISYDERYNIYSDIIKNNNFNSKYKGRLMTIEYEDLSGDKVPMRAKSIGFRDHI